MKCNKQLFFLHPVFYYDLKRFKHSGYVTVSASIQSRDMDSIISDANRITIA